MKLIKEWRSAWKFSTIQWGTVGIVLMGFVELVNNSYISLPPSLQQQIPHSTHLAMVLFFLTMVGRLFKLNEKPTDASQ